MVATRLVGLIGSRRWGEKPAFEIYTPRSSFHRGWYSVADQSDRERVIWLDQRLPAQEITVAIITSPTFVSSGVDHQRLKPSRFARHHPGSATCSRPGR